MKTWEALRISASERPVREPPVGHHRDRRLRGVTSGGDLRVPAFARPNKASADLRRHIACEIVVSWGPGLHAPIDKLPSYIRNDLRSGIRGNTSLNVPMPNRNARLLVFLF